MIRLARYLLPLLLFLAVPVGAVEISGQVVGVTDGDTLTLLTAEKRQVKVRLAAIDTPESKQPYGTRAKQALSNLAFGQPARIDVQTTDRYGRSVARVYVGERDIYAAMVEQGAAWVYRQYAHDPQLLALEAQAQAAKRGLWALSAAEQVPPWEWRQGTQERPSAQTTDRGCRPHPRDRVRGQRAPVNRWRTVPRLVTTCPIAAYGAWTAMATASPANPSRR